MPTWVTGSTPSVWNGVAVCQCQAACVRVKPVAAVGVPPATRRALRLTPTKPPPPPPPSTLAAPVRPCPPPLMQ